MVRVRCAEHPRPEAVAVADDEVGGVERGVVDDPLDALVRGTQRRRLALLLLVILAEEAPVSFGARLAQPLQSGGAALRAFG